MDQPLLSTNSGEPDSTQSSILPLSIYLDKRKGDILKTFAIHRIGVKKWAIISKSEEINRELWMSLYKQGMGESEQQHSVRSVCGESVYVYIRPKLVKHNIVPVVRPIEKQSEILIENPTSSKSTSKQNKTKPKKADMIRTENNLKRMNLDITSEDPPQISTFTSARISISQFHTRFHESLLIRLIRYCQNLLKQYEELVLLYETSNMIEYLATKQVCYRYLIESIIGITKIILEKKKIPDISTTCVSDCFRAIDLIKRQIQFDSLKVIQSYPELVFRTQFDGLLQTNQFEMYQSQKDLVNFAQTNNKFLGLVHTMLGSGKTTTVLPLCGWLSVNKKLGSDTKLIFCCPNEIVLLEVAHMAYGMGIPFAIVVYNQHTQKINYKWSTFVDQQIDNQSRTKVRSASESEFSRGLDTSLDVVRKPKKKVSESTTDPIPSDNEFEIDTDDDENKPAEEHSSKKYYDDDPDIEKNDELRHDSTILYICDMFTCQIMLEQYQEKLRIQKECLNSPKISSALQIPKVPDYILVCDEPTRKADDIRNFCSNDKFSVTTETFVRVMKLAPPKIILMSATLPTYNQLPHFYNAICHQHQIDTSQIKSFAASEAKIGCTIVFASGNVYAPHNGATTCAEIQSLLKVIKGNPFVGRFYTFSTIVEMYNTFKKNDLPVPNLPALLDNPALATQPMIQLCASEMLQTLVNSQSNQMVWQICQKSLANHQTIDLNHIFTKEMWKFKQGCLIFSSDPVWTAKELYLKNFGATTFAQIKFTKIMDKFHADLKVYLETVDRIDKKKNDSVRKQTRESAKLSDDGKKSNKKESTKLADHENAQVLQQEYPHWTFPSEYQIEYQGNTVGPSDIPTESGVSDEILTMLASGIGIYTTDDPQLDDEYLKTVLLLATEQKIRFIITDDSIAYGTNLSVSDIVMIDQPIVKSSSVTVPSITDSHSMKTIFQMLGRAGRGSGLSYTATVYTTSADDRLIGKIQSYVKEELIEGDHDEVQNINRAFESVWNQ